MAALNTEKFRLDYLAPPVVVESLLLDFVVDDDGATQVYTSTV